LEHDNRNAHSTNAVFWFPFHHQQPETAPLHPDPAAGSSQITTSIVCDTPWSGPWKLIKL
jgi:hypothetical protein